MSKYQFAVRPRIDLIERMYRDHGYTVEEICMRLRYPESAVKAIIEKYNIPYGTKSWRS